MENNYEDISIIIGTGYMSKVYFRHLKYLGQNCLMAYRDKGSENYKNAVKEFGNSSLIHIDEAKKLNIKLLLSCVDTQNHLNSIRDFKSNSKLIAIEKPVSYDLNEINNFDFKESTFVLMNRRYYYWVPKVKELIRNNLIYKIVVNIPERNNNNTWHNIPISLIDNSIHVFDLIYYLCEGFEETLFKKIEINSAFVLTNSKKIDEIYFHLNLNCIENFSIKFYLKDNSLISCSPLENATHFKSFNIIQETKKNFVKKYIPVPEPINVEENMMEYEKPGILSLCKDLISYQKGNGLNKIKLPNINQSREVMMWLKNLYE